MPMTHNKSFQIRNLPSSSIPCAKSKTCLIQVQHPHFHRLHAILDRAEVTLHCPYAILDCAHVVPNLHLQAQLDGKERNPKARMMFAFNWFVQTGNSGYTPTIQIARQTRASKTNNAIRSITRWIVSSRHPCRISYICIWYVAKLGFLQKAIAFRIMHESVYDQKTYLRQQRRQNPTTNDLRPYSEKLRSESMPGGLNFNRALRLELA